MARRQIGRECGKLPVDHLEVIDRIAARLWVQVEHVQEEARPLRVAEELMPESSALGGARNQPGQVGNHERPVVVHAHDAERGLERP